jgi:hypothetical protein
MFKQKVKEMRNLIQRARKGMHIQGGIAPSKMLNFCTIFAIVLLKVSSFSIWNVEEK